MEEPKAARPFERLARLRAVQVEQARARFGAARARTEAARVELSDAKQRQRDAERRAGCGILRATGEGSTAALEAVVVGLRRLAELRARLKTARAEEAELGAALEAERAGERAAQQVALERTHALIRWKEARAQEAAEEAFRSRRTELFTTEDAEFTESYAPRTL